MRHGGGCKLCVRRGPVVTYVYDEELGRIGWLKKAIFLFSSLQLENIFLFFSLSLHLSGVWRTICLHSQTGVC